MYEDMMKKRRREEDEECLKLLFPLYIFIKNIYKIVKIYIYKCVQLASDT